MKAEFADLSRQIQTLDKSDKSPAAEIKRRKLWCDLEILRMSIADSSRQITDEAKEVRLSSFRPKPGGFPLLPC